MKRLLLVGGGHSHVEVLRQFGLQPMTDVELVLVSPDRYTPYSGMLPGWIAGHYSHADCHIDLDRLARFAGARFLTDRVTALDPAGHRALLADGSALEYDVAAIDIGSTPPLDRVPGAREHAVPVKPVDRFIERIEALTNPAHAAAPRAVAVIGAGAAGVEVLLSVRHRLQQHGQRSITFAIVSASDAVLPSHAARVQRRMHRILEHRSVALHLSFVVSKVTAGRIHAADGRSVAADFIVAATGADAAAWPRASGLAVDEYGFIAVNEHLQSRSHANVFAAGDIASITDHSYPKSGVYAVRQGPVLATNLRHALRGESLERYLPQPVSLALISTGDRYAIASRGRFCTAGGWVWRWKDWIDRKFMRKYNEL